MPVDVFCFLMAFHAPNLIRMTAYITYCSLVLFLFIPCFVICLLLFWVVSSPLIASLFDCFCMVFVIFFVVFFIPFFMFLSILFTLLCYILFIVFIPFFYCPCFNFYYSTFLIVLYIHLLLLLTVLHFPQGILQAIQCRNVQLLLLSFSDITCNVFLFVVFILLLCFAILFDNGWHVAPI